jgi:hypothetical protein
MIIIWSKTGRGIPARTFCQRTKELLKLNRNQLQWVTGLLVLTGHCHLKGHLFKMRLRNSPTCKRCLEKDEWATHILCDCEAIAYLRFRHLGHYFMEPGDYQDTPVRKILHFIRSVGLLEGWNRGGYTTDLERWWCKGQSKAYPLRIHSFIWSNAPSSQLCQKESCVTYFLTWS